MDFSDQRTEYLEIHFFPYVSKINGAPNWSNFQNVENACNKNWLTLGTILGLKFFEIYGKQCISR